MKQNYFNTPYGYPDQLHRRNVTDMLKNYIDTFIDDDEKLIQFIRSSPYMINSIKRNVFDTIGWAVQYHGVFDDVSGEDSILRKFNEFLNTRDGYFVEKKEIVEKEMEKSSKPPMSMEQLTSFDEEIENPIVVYYTAEGKLNPYDEDKREIFICFSSEEEDMVESYNRRDMSLYERRVITHRGEYKIFPDKPESHQMDVNLWGGENVSDNGHSRLHVFSQGDIMLTTRESVKDEAIETWFPQSNNGCFRDYDSECDIYDMNGPDCLVEGDTSLEACDAVYLYV